MINFKTIAKMLLLAMFICVLSGEGKAQNAKATGAGFLAGAPSEYLSPQNSQYVNNQKHDGYSSSISATPGDIPNGRPLGVSTGCTPPCGDGQQCVQGICEPINASGTGGENSANFCSSDFGLFSSLVNTGMQIFKRLRDLIYVAAGFGIIAVAVGGFFGNLNWKWLGAIVISLVVIATAGELIVLITGCEQFGSSLITNTLTHPTASYTTKDYNEKYTTRTEDADYGKRIDWSDEMDRSSGW